MVVLYLTACTSGWEQMPHAHAVPLHPVFAAGGQCAGAHQARPSAVLSAAAGERGSRGLLRIASNAVQRLGCLGVV